MYDWDTWKPALKEMLLTAPVIVLAVFLISLLHENERDTVLIVALVFILALVFLAIIRDIWKARKSGESKTQKV